MLDAAGRRLLVRLEVADPGKLLAALVAAVGFLPRVDPLVLLQVPRLGETLPTCVAFERPLPCVHSLVDLQIGPRGERFAAGFADELLADLQFQAIVALD